MFFIKFPPFAHGDTPKLRSQDGVGALPHNPASVHYND